MKKSIIERNKKVSKLSLRSETIRVLTERELALVVAGNCVMGSSHSQATVDRADIC